jgi:hypothetical protein
VVRKLEAAEIAAITENANRYVKKSAHYRELLREE